jgi:hypothetical protein
MREVAMTRCMTITCLKTNQVTTLKKAPTKIL